MTPKQFVDCIENEIIGSLMIEYESILEKGVSANVTNPYWRSVLELYVSLDSEGKKTLKRAMKQTAIDMTAAILGVIDGVVLLEEFRDDFELRYGGIKINEDLQDLFLARYSG